MKRYKIESDGSYTFYDFNNCTFNYDVWLEDDGRFELDEEGKHYTHYNKDGSPDTAQIAQANIEAIKAEAKAFLKTTNDLVPTDIQAELTEEESADLAADRAVALSILNGATTYSSKRVGTISAISRFT